MIETSMSSSQPIAHHMAFHVAQTPVAQPAEANGEPLAELDAVSDYLPKDNGKSMGTFAKEVLDNYKLAFANSCDRHFKNESNDVIWEVRGSEGSGVCEPAACVVKPHQTITVHYPVIEKSFRFTVSSNGTGGNAYHDDFEVKQGNVIETGNCAYIKHDGRTGLAKLNDGANGDITFLNGDAALPSSARAAQGIVKKDYQYCAATILREASDDVQTCSRRLGSAALP